MGISTSDVEQVLVAIGFRAGDIPHPVDLLTIERVAAEAFISAKTIDSALGGSTTFRTEVLAGAVSRLRSRPGHGTWQALQDVVERPDERWFARLLAARADELAADPAFPLVLSAFERLDQPTITSALNAEIVELVDSFQPFLTTGAVAAGRSWPSAPAPVTSFVLLIAVLAESYRRLLRLGAGQHPNERVTDVLADFIEAEASAAVGEGPQLDELLPIATGQPQPNLESNLGGRAVEAGAELLLTDSVPFTSALTVAEVRKRTGLSNATFYRHFGSIAKLDALLLERAGREIADGFSDAFFDGVLADLDAGTTSLEDAVVLFLDRLQWEQRRHIDEGRPGREVTPWLATNEVGSVAARAYQMAYEERGAFYERFCELLGARLRPGIAGRDMAGGLNAVSVVSDLLIRNAPVGEAALSVIRHRAEGLYQRFLA